MIPTALERFFWDASPEDIDLVRNKRYVISRILEYGDEAAVRWLKSKYSAEKLRSEVLASRSLSPKSRNYWKLMYDIA